MRRLLVLAMMLMAVVLVVRLRAQPSVKAFQGYWMGVDPLDGGDSFLTLCDNSDYGIATFEDGVVASHRVMTSDHLKLACFGNKAEVSLRARYELVSDGVMIETLTAQDGSPVDRIVFHKASKE